MGEFGPTFVAAPCLHRLSLPLSHTHSFLVTFLSPSYDLIFLHASCSAFFFQRFCNCEEEEDCVYSFLFKREQEAHG